MTTTPDEIIKDLAHRRRKLIEVLCADALRVASVTGDELYIDPKRVEIVSVGNVVGSGQESISVNLDGKSVGDVVISRDGLKFKLLLLRRFPHDD